MSTKADDALLQEIRDRFQYAWDEWATIRDEAKKDMRYVSGDPWDEVDKRARKSAGRPYLAPDELGQHFNQVINGVRSNKRAIKFSPTGNGASEKTAEFYRDKTREIEYRSHAQTAYTTAFQDAVHRSYGFLRLTTKYESERSFNQEIWIEPIPNPDMVLPDPDAQRPDSSDMKYCFVYQQRSHEEFEREYPDAKVVNFAPLVGMEGYTLWVHPQKVLVAEYWTIKQRRRRLLLIQLPAVPAGGMLGLQEPAAPAPVEVFEDELDLERLPPGAKIIRDRPVDEPSVCQYVTNGVEILEKTEWPGKYIPIASCYGMVLWVEGKKQIVSMTRLARDPFMAFCYAVTGAVEVAGSTTKNPYWAYEGQLSPDQINKVAESLHQPVAVLLAKPQLESLPGTLLPLPQRNSLSPDIGGWTVLMEFFRRSIQAAMGSSPLPTSAQRRNEKSGIALQQIEDTAQRGSFHFNDHYDGMIRHTGVMIEDLMGKIHDTAKDLSIRKPNDTTEIVRVNDPRSAESIDTKGDHLVTVSTGPSFDSERDAEAAFADALLASPFGPRIADLAVKLKGGGPVMDEIAERLTPPEFAKPSEDGQPTPQMVAQLQGQLQQVTQAAQEMKQALDTDQVKTQGQIAIKELDLKKAQFEAEKEYRLQAMKDATAIHVAEIAAASRVGQAAHDDQHEAIALGQQQAFDAEQAERDRQHEAALTQLEHQQALEAGQQGADLGMVQAEHTQAMQPPPEAVL